MLGELPVPLTLAFGLVTELESSPRDPNERELGGKLTCENPEFAWKRDWLGASPLGALLELVCSTALAAPPAVAVL